MPEKLVVTMCDSVKLPITSCCPHCNYGPLDGVTEIQGRTQGQAREDFKEVVDPPTSQPYPGAISICAKCAGLLIYDTIEERLGVREMTDKELAELKSDPEHWNLVRRMQAAFRKPRGKN